MQERMHEGGQYSLEETLFTSEWGGAGGSFTQTLKTIGAVEQKGLACATSRSKGTQ